MTRKALGRGLSALIREPEPDAAPREDSSSPAPLISVSLIEPNPFQPRTTFSDSHLRELVESVRLNGVIQPVLVRPLGDRYQLVAGERRWRAASMAGLEAVPAIVRNIDDREALELALTENLLRDDLGPLEAARAYHALQEQFGATQDEIAQRLGLNRATVANSLRLLRLPATIQQMIEREELTAGHARALLALEDEGEQIQLARKIVARGLSVRETEKLASGREDRAITTAESPPSLKPSQSDPNIKAAVAALERRLGTRVRISGDGEHGRIEISYFSAEDLNRLYEMILDESARNESA